MNTRNTSRKNAMGTTLLVMAALSTTMLAGVTQAATFGDNVPKQAVVYKDLNLEGSAGAQMLYKRIQGAANQVCGKADGRDLQAVSAQKACVKRAVSDAVAAVNSTMLTRVHLAKSGSPVRQTLAIAQVH
jgi:UrcA family protein